jgi:bifunctional non-homologous end joining protein LigD
LLQASAEQGLEGIVAKRLDSRYLPGRRSPAWIKVKHRRRQELVIGGWLPEQGRAERIGALLVGYHDKDGLLRYAGRVGSGFNQADIADLEERLAPLRRSGPPFSGRRGPRSAIYVEPELAAEIEFGEWTSDRILRAPSFKGLRALDPRHVVLRQQDGVMARSGDGRKTSTSRGRSGGSGASGKGAGRRKAERPPDAGVLGQLRELPSGSVEVTIEGRELRLSNLDKVMYPSVGFTKRDVIEYYTQIAPALLPHLRGRPLTLKRYPDGVEGQFFYEKQCPSHRPPWVQTAAIWSRHNKRTIDFCLVNDLTTLVWTSNLADLELHTSMSLAKEISLPTMMVFDLDPGPPADIVHCSRVGLRLRDLFAQLGLEAFPKTSGSKGLQVYVPLNTKVTYSDTKPFARAVAELLEKQHPKQVVSRMTKQLRPGKVLIDWSQNDEHKTTVCVYSLRAKERPTVSTPVTWEEVEACARTRRASRLVFDSADVLGRVADQGDLFAPVLTAQQQLPELGI